MVLSLLPQQRVAAPPGPVLHTSFSAAPRTAPIRVYDMNSAVRVRRIQGDFANLSVDPYIKEGYRRKHIVRYRVHEQQLVRSPHAPLYQSSKWNPTHGNIPREYPPFDPCPETLKLITHVARLLPVPEGEEILVQAQRITCDPNHEGLPSVENWHRDGVDGVGVFCAARHNVTGGVNQFRTDDEGVFAEHHLGVGHMVVFGDEPVQHRVTPISTADERGGYRDVLLFGYPATSR